MSSSSPPVSVRVGVKGWVSLAAINMAGLALLGVPNTSRLAGSFIYLPYNSTGGAWDWNRCKDYRGIDRLLSYMNKDEGYEVNHCCQVFSNFSASMTKFICHIFCINFVIINFVTYKLCYL
jgi:hypothetical protein